MYNMFNITKCSRFLFLHIVRHILVLKSKKIFVAIAAVWFKLMTSFKFAGILNSGIRIEINLAIDLTSSADSASDFDYWSLAVAFLYERSMFLLVPL